MVKSAVMNDIGNADRKVYNPKPKVDIEEISKLIDKTITYMKEIMMGIKNDLEIIDIIGFDAYRVVKFTLYQTQNINIKPSTLLSTKELIQKIPQATINNYTRKYKGNVIYTPGHPMYNSDTQTHMVDTQLYEIIYNDEHKMQNNFYFLKHAKFGICSSLSVQRKPVALDLGVR